MSCPELCSVHSLTRAFGVPDSQLRRRSPQLRNGLILIFQEAAGHVDRDLSLGAFEVRQDFGVFDMSRSLARV